MEGFYLWEAPLRKMLSIPEGVFLCIISFVQIFSIFNPGQVAFLIVPIKVILLFTALSAIYIKAEL